MTHNTTTCSAVYIDFKGKQDYIFSSNKLKTHIGASRIIQLALSNVLYETLNSVLGFGDEPFQYNQWETKPSELFVQNTSFDVAFIGGGNALLFFKDLDSAKIFVETYSGSIQEKYPGLERVLTLYENFDYSDVGYKSSIDALFAQARIVEQALIGRHKRLKLGLEKKCALSDGAASTYNKTVQTWVSEQVNAKLEASEKLTLANFFDSDLIKELGIKQSRVDYILKKYALSDIIDHLNTEDDKGIIAVIHLDGNGLGKSFSDIKTLSQFREKSAAVNRKLKETELRFFDEIINEFENETFEKGFINLKEVNHKLILPFRPIINAGDDITFICHGKLGIYYAEKYQRLISEGDQGIYTCSGVLICKTHQPLHKAYVISEELARLGKDISREHTDTSWLTWISHSGAIGDNVLQEVYNSNGTKVKGNSYILGQPTERTPTIKRFNDLLDKSISIRQSLSRNKTEEMKKGFLAPELRPELEVQLLNSLEFKEPDILLEKAKTFFDTYSFDAIEIERYYPKFKN